MFFHSSANYFWSCNKGILFGLSFPAPHGCVAFRHHSGRIANLICGRYAQGCHCATARCTFDWHIGRSVQSWVGRLFAIPIIWPQPNEESDRTAFSWDIQTSVVSAMQHRQPVCRSSRLTPNSYYYIVFGRPRMCIRRQKTIFVCYYLKWLCKSRLRIFSISETLTHNIRAWAFAMLLQIQDKDVRHFRKAKT